MPEQKITSAGTSLNQIPAIWKLMNNELPHWPWFYYNRVLDYGGGKYDKFTKFLAKQGITNLVYDPYNRDEDHNDAIRAELSDSPADMCFCSNVLNVVKEPAAREETLQNISAWTKKESLAFFTVYEGDKSSNGKCTTKGWQANRPTESYVVEIERYFPKVRRKGKLIIATNG